MNLLKLLKVLMLLTWKNALQSLLIIIGLTLLPYKNIGSVISLVLVIGLSFKLIESIIDGSKSLSVKEWIRFILTVTLIVGLPYLVFLYFGGLGLISILIIPLGWLVYILYSNWKLYDYTTSWGAKRLFKDSVEEFDLTKVK